MIEQLIWAAQCHASKELYDKQIKQGVANGQKEVIGAGLKSHLNQPRVDIHLPSAKCQVIRLLQAHTNHARLTSRSKAKSLPWS